MKKVKGGVFVSDEELKEVEKAVLRFERYVKERNKEEKDYSRLDMVENRMLEIKVYGLVQGLIKAIK